MPGPPLNLLCVEPRFPGRLGQVAEWLARRRGYRVRFACHQLDSSDDRTSAHGPRIDVIPFDVGGIAREPSVPWWRGFERGLCYAFGAWEVVDARRPRPIDAILGRSCGLGSTLFMPVTYPRAPIVQYFDQFLHPRANDLADEDAPRLPDEYVLWRRSANAMDLADLENGVTPWTSSHWQRDLYPSEYRDTFVVIPHSIDTTKFDRPASVPRHVGGRTVPDGMKIVTFVASALDRLHGFDRFVMLAEKVLSVRSDTICIAAGNPTTGTMLDVSHHGTNYPEALLATHPLRGHERFWVLGSIPRSEIAGLLSFSDLHVCPERVHPVSTPLLEAMAARCVILAADTATIRGVVSPERCALLASFREIGPSVQLALEVLDDPTAFASLAGAAAEVARARFDHDRVLPALADLLTSLSSA
jgi:glycosyltransferase involved in cell wall biosynthesis